MDLSFTRQRSFLSNGELTLGQMPLKLCVAYPFFFPMTWQDFSMKSPHSSSGLKGPRVELNIWACDARLISHLCWDRKLNSKLWMLDQTWMVYCLRRSSCYFKASHPHLELRVRSRYVNSKLNVLTNIGNPSLTDRYFPISIQPRLNEINMSTIYLWWVDDELNEYV